MAGARGAIGSLLVCAAMVAIAGESHAQTTAPPEGWVVLPVDEYRELRTRALGEPTPPAAIPVEATLTRIDYELRGEAAAGSVLTGRARLTIDVLRDGWTRVDVPAGLMVRDARLNGQAVSLVKMPSPHVLLQRAGRHQLDLELVVPLTSSAGAESIALPASAAPISQVALELPRSGVDLTVNGGFVADRAESTAQSRWTVIGRPKQRLALSWRRRVEDQRSELPLKTRARITHFVGLGEDASQVSASVRVDVLQGLAREITLALPSGLVVNQVTGATVADWEAIDATLRVRLLDPAPAEASFVVQAEVRAPREGTIVIPMLRMPSADRETGGVAVDVIGAGEISGQQARALEPVDPAELGEIVGGRQSPSMVAFRLRPVNNADASLSVRLVRYTPQAVLIANVEEARYRALASDDGRLLVEAKYAVRNNQRSFLKVTLPEGSTLWTAAVSGRRVHPGKAEGDAVLLPLDKGRAGEQAPTFVVELVYLQPIGQWRDKGHERIVLPAVDLPISRTGLELRYSPRFRVEPEPGVFRAGVDYGPFAEALRPPAARGVGVAQSGVAGGVVGGTIGSVPPPPVAAPSRSTQAMEPDASNLQKLVDRFNNESGGRTVVGSLPVALTFPEFGPSMFLASELTPEAQAPSLDLAFRRR